jgi:hypothetical protein
MAVEAVKTLQILQGNPAKFAGFLQSLIRLPTFVMPKNPKKFKDFKGFCRVLNLLAR